MSQPMSAAGPQAGNCPRCGAPRITHAAAPCWLCGAPLGETSAAAPQPRRTADLVAAIIVTTTLGIVALGNLLYAPGIGLLLLVLFTPILWAVWRDPSGSGSAGGRPGARSVAAIIGTVIAAAIAATVAFFAACWGGFFAGVVVGETLGAQGHDYLLSGLVCAFVAGPLAGIVVATLVLRKLWRKPDLGGAAKAAALPPAIPPADPTAITGAPPGAGSAFPGNQTGIKNTEGD